jgi:hypothetical protein
MQYRFENSPKNNALLFLLTILLNISALVFSTQNGIKLTDDSHYYLFAAKTFAEKGEMLKPDGSLFCEWPPLFPFILSVFKGNLSAILGLNILSSCLSFGLIFYISCRLLSTFSARSLWGVFLSVSVSWLLVHVFLWSEPLFMLFLYSAIFFGTSETEKNGIFYALLSGMFFLAAILQRNLALPFFAGFAFFFLVEKLYFKKELHFRHIFIFLLPVLGILWYKIYFPCSGKVSENLFTRSFFDNFMLYAETLGSLLLPKQIFAALIFGTGFTFFCLLFPLTSIFFKKNDHSTFLMPVSGGLSAYISAILIFSPATAEDSERLLAPVFPLILLQTAYFFEKLKRENFTFSYVLPFVFLAISLVYLFFRFVKNCLFFAA